MITRLERFWRHVEKTAGCWLWQGSLNYPDGYGQFCGSTAHRFSYEIARGPIPPGLYVLHHCDVKRCVNPDHLYAGTQKDNGRDAVQRGGIDVARLRAIQPHATAAAVLARRERAGPEPKCLDCGRPLARRAAKRCRPCWYRTDKARIGLQAGWKLAEARP